MAQSRCLFDMDWLSLTSIPSCWHRQLKVPKMAIYNFLDLITLFSILQAYHEDSSTVRIFQPYQYRELLFYLLLLTFLAWRSGVLPYSYDAEVEREFLFPLREHARHHWRHRPSCLQRDWQGLCPCFWFSGPPIDTRDIFPAILPTWCIDLPVVGKLKILKIIMK